MQKLIIIKSWNRCATVSTKILLLQVVRDKTFADKLMLFPNDDTQNDPSHKSQLMVEKFRQSTWWPPNQNSIKVPKVVKPTNKNTLL